DNFFELGGDSILGIQIISKANQKGLRLTLKQLFQHQSIAKLAAVTGTTQPIQTEQELVIGIVPITPIQQWFFEQEQPNPHHWNQALLLEVQRDLNPFLLEKVTHYLLVNHDALRLRFIREESGWKQFIACTNTIIPFSKVDLSALLEAEQRIAIESVARQVQGSLNIFDGSLVRVTLLDLGYHKPSRLLIVIHHLGIDGVSWRILLEDLQKAYQQLNHNDTIQLPPKTTSFKHWAERLLEYSQSVKVEQELNYWLAVPPIQLSALPKDYPSAANTEISRDQVFVSLSVQETQSLLHEVPEAYHTQINDVLLTALVEVFAGWTKQPYLFFDFEGHGREDILEGVDLSRTVGRFVTFHPVCISLPETECSFDAKLKSIKEQLRQIPNRGIGYGLLRYMSRSLEIAEKLRAQPHPEVSFNYLGQVDKGISEVLSFKTAPESSGPLVSDQTTHTHLLSITGKIEGGRLSLEWTYSKNIHIRSTIETLAQNFIKVLRLLIVYCQSPKTGGYTPSDFPLASLNQLQLDQMFGANQQVEDIYPLSPIQEGILYHNLYAPELMVYSLQLHYILQEEIDITAFKRAWQEVINQYSAMRTAFIWQRLAQPLQVVHKQAQFSIHQEDWRHFPLSEQNQQLQAFLEADRSQGFDLCQPPLMRVALLQVSQDRYHLVLSYSQLLMDGWSMSLILKNVFTSYKAFCAGHTPRLKPSRSYRDYIVWLQQQDLSRAEAFWRHALQGFYAPTPLMVDQLISRSTKQVVNEEQEYRFSAEVTAALYSFARNHQLTVNTVVQGSWALLLSRYSGHKDVLFGATVSCRPVELLEVESRVGLFINTLPVRVQISPENSVLPWLKKLQIQQREAQQYDYSPLREVQNWCDLPRGLSLFDSILVFENHPLHGSLRQQVGLKSDQIHEMDQTHYPLTAFVVPESEMLIRLSYNPNCFAAATIRRMLGHFQSLLEGIVTNPKQHLWDLPLLTKAERKQLLEEWNDTKGDYPKNLCIHQLFEAQVERTPDAVAIVYENEQLSYQELNSRANQLAHYLQTLGIGPEVRVGLCVERSLLMMV
ncbi:condensation domain-containing protein, partial [Nostoc sp. CCY 9925]|uniref:condensation domain-containing protein n=1 Tax=Nostoc sp. CCY 9925 TaxID=3103865 RepID=UPI0039C73F77